MTKTLDLNYKTILISRTDSIGDVVLTLPLCIWIKEQYPNAKLIFLGRSYTLPVLKCLPQIDEFISWDELEQSPSINREQLLSSKKIDVCIHVFPKREIAAMIKKIKIPVRIGTSHRSFHLLTCNQRVNFSRKKSNLHEAQLNFELLRPLGLKEIPELNVLSDMLGNHFHCPESSSNAHFSNIKDAVILHPKSQGSALEWPLEKFIHLAERLLEAGEKVVFTGTEKEGLLFREAIPKHPNCHDLSGKMSLEELIAFISGSKALVACSTGPLHLAGASKIRAIGLFSSRKPIHPGRWKALGPNSVALEFDPNCSTCKKGKPCNCITSIAVETVLDLLKKK